MTQQRLVLSNKTTKIFMIFNGFFIIFSTKSKLVIFLFISFCSQYYPPTVKIYRSVKNSLIFKGTNQNCRKNDENIELESM